MFIFKWLGGGDDKMPGGKKQLSHNEFQFGYWFVSKGDNK